MAKLKQKALQHSKAMKDPKGKKIPSEYNEYGVHLWVLVHGF